MADADVPITAGVGTKVDTRTVGAGTDEHRQVVVIGDPVTAANVVLVDASGRIIAIINGDVAHDAADANSPVKIGGRAYSGAPAAVSAANDRTDAAFTLRGALHSHLVDSSGTSITTGVQYVEDTALAANVAQGTLVVARRDDALSTLTPVEDDAIGLRVNNRGALWVATDSVITGDVSAAPNVTTGITAFGIGPGYDRKTNPTGIAVTSIVNAVTVVVDGANSITFHVMTIGVTPGSMIIETTADDTTWVTAGTVIKLGATEQYIESSFVPAVNDVYMVRVTGLRQVRYRVNAVYASGTATIEVTASLGLAIIKAVEMVAAPHKFGYSPVNLSETFTTAQTSLAINTAPGNADNVVSATQKFVATSIQIQAYATTAFTCIVYFGTGAFSRGTNRVIFDGEFAPSATFKPGAIQQFSVNPPIGAVDEEVRITTVGAGSVTVNVWGYLIVA